MAAAEAEPPLRVLADPELFRHAASFLSGEPLIVAQYLAFMEDKRLDWDPGRDLFWQHAVYRRDRDTLRSLHAHSRHPTQSPDAFSRCNAIVSVAVALFVKQQSRRLLQRMLALVVETPLDMAFLDWLADTFADEHHRRWFYEEAQTVAEHGSVELVQWICGRQLARDGSLLDCAARFGRMDLVQLLHKESRCSVYAMDYAASEGHFEIVKFLHVNRSEGCTIAAMDGAAASGHLAIVRFLHENRSEGCTTAAMNSAAASGHLAVLRYLHENRSEGCSRAAMSFGAGRGHLACVRYLHEQRLAGFTADAMSYAVTNGHLRIVQFLHANRSEGCTSWALLEAAKRGHRAVVDFLCAHRPMQNPDWLLQRAKNERLGRLVARLERMQAATTSATKVYAYS